MKVLWSLDPVALEEHLVRRVLERPGKGLVDPVLVVVPTRRLALHLKARLARDAGAVLGAHILTHRGLAVRALECALEVPPRVAPRILLELLLDRLAAGEPEADSEYLRTHPGARSALLATFQELREAGVTAEELRDPTVLGAGIAPLVPRFYSRWVEAVGRLRSADLSDRAGLIEAAIPHVGPFLRRKGFRLAIHHGAYELTGVHLELLGEVASSVEAEVLLPAGLEGAAVSYAGGLVAALRDRGARFEPIAPRDPARRAWTDALCRLHEPSGDREGAAPERTPALEVVSVQGVETELEVAALRALALHAKEDVPLEEIAIVARSLEPYVPHVAPVFARLGVPFTTSASEPLARDPVVSAFLALLEVLASDFSRSRTIDLLRRRALDFRSEEPPGEGAPVWREVDRWDRWSREARVASGLASWRELRAWVERPRDIDEGEGDVGEAAADARREARVASAGGLLGILERLETHRARWAEARSFREHAASLRELARAYLRPRDAASAAGLGASRQPERADLPASIESILAGVDAAGRLLESSGIPSAAEDGAGAGPVSVADVARLARAIADSTDMPIEGSRDGGIRLLDVMQARGMPHRVVLWIGFHDGSFPRKAGPDPWLDDRARGDLAERTGRPVARKMRAAEEERLLLATTLSAATERLVLSFQRADEGGRRIARSSALREVARAFTGKADARPLLEEDPGKASRPAAATLARVSAHPGDRAVELASSPRVGLVLPAHAVVAGAVRAHDGPGAARGLASKLLPPERCLGAALDCVAELERFEGVPTAYDGVTAAGVPDDRALSPTAIELLARCPLAFFLRHVLRVRELDEEATHRVEDQAIGSAVHKTLAEVYRWIEGEGGLGEGGPGADAILRALREAWERRLRQAAGATYGRFEALFAILRERWSAALESFVRDDLDELRARGAGRVETERTFEATVDLAKGTAVKLEGRADRVVKLPEGWLVDDYKTGGDVKEKLNPAGIIRGLHLQLPLYREALAAALEASPSEVRARLLQVRPDAEGEEAELDGSEALRASFLETAAGALELARKGAYPLFPSDTSSRYCGWCGYRKTCRKTHQPTLARLAGHEASAALQAIRTKDPSAFSRRKKKADPGREEADGAAGR